LRGFEASVSDISLFSLEKIALLKSGFLPKLNKSLFGVKVIKFVFIDTCSSIYFMGRSKCGSHLLMVIYKIQANHDGMDPIRMPSG
jgi:hypothetical protein